MNKKHQPPKQSTPSSLSNSSNAAGTYNAREIEAKWQEVWEKEKIYEPDIDTAKRPFYNLMMFPYPSAEGLHVGSFFTYGGIDAYGRFKRMQGYDVFEPIGLDGFGIHSENYAIKVGRTPHEHAEISEKNFYRQLRLLGNGFDWSSKLETYDPAYYKWTQWLFIELFKAGLAYKSEASVNFCPSCKTVLSDEQVIDGKCERCSSEVEKRQLSQWFFRITDYAERLLKNTETLDWTEKVKIAQKNWIGKKVGANVKFKVKSVIENEVKQSHKKEIAASSLDGTPRNDIEIDVFTTRPDTLFGATFLVVAPEHPIVEEILKQVQDDKIMKGIEQYVKEASSKENMERTAEGKEKTGVFSGIYAVNPVNGEEIPIWIADYVLMDFGTGAIMAVPAHDQRDFDFAYKYKLPIKSVIASKEDVKKGRTDKPSTAYLGEGYIVNSGPWDGWQTPESIDKVSEWLEEKGYGKKSVNYHLRDWLISRQRYWGPPIPMIYCEACHKKGDSWFTGDSHKSRKLPKSLNLSEMAGWYPEDQLPVLLPVVEDFKPLGTGKAPLANYPEFYKTTCPGCGSEATRETDVSDTFLDSAWYFFRYVSTDTENAVFDTERVKKWLPVTSYIGGAEHAVLHLLYSRFITMVLKDRGHIDFEEPYARFRANGLIIKDGAKMSKSKGNVINPDDYVKKYGADTLRTYLAFVGPFVQGGDFQDTGIDGINRFLKRVWHMFTSGNYKFEGVLDPKGEAHMHQIIKGATEDLEELRFNTVIAKAMTFYNYLSDLSSISQEAAEVLLKLLAPFAPHMAEELYQQIFGNSKFEIRNSKFNSIHLQPWPEYDEGKLISDEVTIAIQINGKLRDTVIVSRTDNGDQSKVEEMAKAKENVIKHLGDQVIKKVIYIPGKILNLVV